MPDKERHEVLQSRERRIAVEVRAAGDEAEMYIEGYAAKFNQVTQIYSWMQEEIAPGAFTEALAKSDIRFVVNHDENLVFARSTNGTLLVSQDETGLKYRAKLPNTELARHYYQLVKDGTISQSSFMFTVEVWEYKDLDGYNELWIIKKVKELFDVSMVTYPAYNDTSAEARNSQGSFAKNENRTKNTSVEVIESVDNADKRHPLEDISARKALVDMIFS